MPPEAAPEFHAWATVTRVLDATTVTVCMDGRRTDDDAYLVAWNLLGMLLDELEARDSDDAA
jgi:hypothetical protein